MDKISFIKIVIFFQMNAEAQIRLCAMERLQVLDELCSTMSYSTHAFSVNESTLHIK